MNGCELALGITALASALAAQIEDDDDLSVLAAAVTQFGDTLATIAAWRARCAVEAAKQEATQTNEQNSEQSDSTKQAKGTGDKKT
ncbi:MAG: hypothetical protein FWE28_09340 [Oscillospiraceae bacterium]|nr:hypothetical protein [Oscillospiraceae bacterium]